MFLARGLTADPTARPCGDEKIATVRMGFADVLGLIDTGRITDALTIVALFKVERFLTRERAGAKPNYSTDLPEEFQRLPGQ